MIDSVKGIPVTWYMVARAVVLGFFVAYAATGAPDSPQEGGKAWGV